MPISIKGVVVDTDRRYLLAANDRDEWELLGGRIEPGEDPRDTVQREIAEESGIDAVVNGSPLDSYVFDVGRPYRRRVFIVTYGCRAVPSGAAVRPSAEHGALKWFSFDAVMELSNLPACYRRPIENFHGEASHR